MARTGIPYFKAWVIYTISTVVLAMLCGMAVGFVLGIAMGIAGIPLEQIQLICTVIGFLLGLTVSFIMFRWVVDKFVVPSVSAPTNAV